MLASGALMATTRALIDEPTAMHLRALTAFKAVRRHSANTVWLPFQDADSGQNSV
jgi:hypothetical protein